MFPTPVTTRRFPVGAAAVIAVATALLFAAAAPAAAKGPQPTSLDGPGLAGPVDLRQVDDWELIGDLMNAMGLYRGSGDAIGDPAPDDLGPAYTLTWHSPVAAGLQEPVIVQHIHAHRVHGLVIHTPPQAELDAWQLNVSGWHVAPATLEPVLERLGVTVQLGRRVALTGQGTTRASPLTDVNVTEPASPTAPAAPSASGSAMQRGVLVAVAVAVIGASGCLLAARAYPGIRHVRASRVRPSLPRRSRSGAIGVTRWPLPRQDRSVLDDRGVT